MGAKLVLRQVTACPENCDNKHTGYARVKLGYVMGVRYNKATNERKQMSNFANWKSYPFTVDGVNFLSLIDPNGSMYKTIKNLSPAVFANMNEGAIRAMIGNVSTITRDEIQAELDRVNEGYQQAYLALA